MKQHRRFGVDVGGVAIDSYRNPPSTPGDVANTAAVPGAIDVMAKLTKKYGPRSVRIISKCGLRMEQKILLWMHDCNFFERTGVLPKDINFVRERWQKAPECRRLQITDMIDDRLDVLRHIDPSVNRILFQGHADEIEKYADLLPHVHHVQSWQEIAETYL